MTIQYKRKTSKTLLKLLGILKCNIKTLRVGKIIIVIITHITFKKISGMRIVLYFSLTPTNLFQRQK